MDFADPALTLLHCVSSFLLNKPYTLLLPRKGAAFSIAADSCFGPFCVPLLFQLCALCQAAISLFRGIGAFSLLTPEAPTAF